MGDSFSYVCINITFYFLQIFQKKMNHKYTCIGLVHSGCSNKIPHTGGFINHKHVLPTVLEAGSPRSGCQCFCVMVKALFWVQSSCCILTWGKGKEAISGLFHKATNHIHDGSGPLSLPSGDFHSLLLRMQASRHPALCFVLSSLLYSCTC